MKIMTILGTRPEIIRLSLVVEQLDRFSQHVLVHTGQNADDRLNGLFFKQLGVREPDYRLSCASATFGEQVGRILASVEEVIVQQQPDRVLILGDTNSGLAALAARRLGIPVYHMEAGNRCFDDRVPEEINRRVIDHVSTVLLPYTERSRQNLLAEGLPLQRIFVTGNPIRQVIQRHETQIGGCSVLADLELEPSRYILVTLHRAENVDSEPRLRSLLGALAQLRKRFGYPVIGSLHPRTADRICKFGVDLHTLGLTFLPPLGFFEFVRLEQSAFCILSDSGTVQEEACLFGTPNVTLRDVSERPETLECGSNMLAGSEPEAIVDAVGLVTSSQTAWCPPAEYLRTDVAETVCRIVCGFRLPDEAERQRTGRRRTENC